MAACYQMSGTESSDSGPELDSSSFSSAEERVESSDEKEPTSAVAAEAAAVRGSKRQGLENARAKAMKWRWEIAAALAAPEVAAAVAEAGLPPAGVMLKSTMEAHFALAVALEAREKLSVALAKAGNEAATLAEELLSRAPAFMSLAELGTRCACGMPWGSVHRH